MLESIILLLERNRITAVLNEERLWGMKNANEDSGCLINGLLQAF